MDKKICLECDEAITGRIDKKFCSDACRNAYNNKQNKDANNYVRNVNNILRKNRRVLQDLAPKGKSKVNRSKLLSKGYDFNYYTNIYKTGTGNVYYFCYEYGYLSLPNEEYAIVCREEYLKS